MSKAGRAFRDIGWLSAHDQRRIANRKTRRVPVNTVLPVITGTATEGETLTASNGTWDNSPDSYAYQWKADDVAISGATASTFELTTDEVGAVITVTVTATNAAGSTAATSAGTEAVEAVDPYFADVALQVQFSGADGSTTFTDESTNGHTLTASGAAAILNDKLRLPGALGDFVWAADSPLWQLSGDFCFELFGVEFDDGVGIQGMLSQYGAPSGTTTTDHRAWSWRRNLDGYQVGISTAGAGATFQGTTAGYSGLIPYDFCLEREGSTIRFFRDGIELFNVTNANTSYDAPTILRIGAESNGTVMQGSIKAVRMTQGRIRYGGAYTVPNLPLPVQ